jgi:hypothetical protein
VHLSRHPAEGLSKRGELEHTPFSRLSLPHGNKFEDEQTNLNVDVIKSLLCAKISYSVCTWIFLGKYF